MKKIEFVKYTSNGNNFVIVDETTTGMLQETEKSFFAFQATNTNYGIGCDNFLVIQGCTDEILKDINNTRHYWTNLPNSKDANYIFRMFEPDGQEAFCCANGLICIADYLYYTYGVESARIFTEIPTSKPKVVSIGTDSATSESWINIGHPRPIPPTLTNSSYLTSFKPSVDVLQNYEITFRKHDLAPFSNKRSLFLNGYIVFTGEPHMVVVSQNGFSIPELFDLLFTPSCQELAAIQPIEKRIFFGTWLVHHIGTALNNKDRHTFPVGININFVKVDSANTAIEYRCFERGINKETLSCGTGALAAAFVAQQLNLFSGNTVLLWPHRCRWVVPKAQITVKRQEDGWMLSSIAEMLFVGQFQFHDPFFRPKSDCALRNTLASHRFADCVLTS